MRLTDQAKKLLHERYGRKFNVLAKSLSDCNVATLAPPPRKSYFDSSADPNVNVVEIDNKTLTDFQRMRESESEDIRKSLLALIEYYCENDNLNIILLADVLETRQSYIRYTAQLANYLRHTQSHYSMVKVQFDNLTTRLGIFCRKSQAELGQIDSFVGSIRAALIAYGSASVPLDEVPEAYKTNRALLKHVLKKRFPNPAPSLEWTDRHLSVFLNSSAQS